MGCNIHAFIEAKKRTKLFQKKWKLVDVYPYKKRNEDGGYDHHSSRNYPLYAYMADVRNYAENSVAIIPRRGVPKDASDTYREIVKYDGSDGHSHSWLSLDELRKIPWDRRYDIGTSYETTLKKFSKEFWQEIMLPMETIEALGTHDVRLVFHFDN